MHHQLRGRKLTHNLTGKGGVWSHFHLLSVTDHPCLRVDDLYGILLVRVFCLYRPRKSQYRVLYLFSGQFAYRV